MGNAPATFTLRWAVVPAVILALIGLLSFGKSYFLTSIDRDWDSIGGELNEELSTQVERSIRSYASELMVESSEMLRNPHLKAALKSAGADRRAFQRDLLNREDIHDIAVLAYNADEEVIAYNRVAPRSSPLDGFEHNEDRWHVVVRPTRSFLLYREAVYDDGERIGDLVISRALSASLPLTNRFLTSRGFGLSLEEELGLEVIFDFDGSSPLHHDGRYLHVPFIAENDTLGYAHIQKVIPAVQASRLDGYFETAIAFLFIVFFFIASIPVHRWYAARISGGWYIPAVTLHVWAVRIAFFALGIGETILPAEMLDPVHYASSFGEGLASSPGVLFITLLALTVNTLAAAYRIRSWQPGERRKALYGTVLAIVILVQPFILRGFAAAMRSFVADSGFNYDDIASLFDTPMIVVMYVNTFLLAASVAAGVAASIAISARIIARLTESRPAQAGIALLLAAVSILIFVFTTREYLLALSVYLLYAGLFTVSVTGAAQWAMLQRIRPARAALIVLVLMTLSVSALLSLYMNERRRTEVEAIAETVARSEDIWTKVQVEQTLNQIRALPPGAFESGRNEYRTAFNLWTDTPLSSMQNNSAVMILDANGDVFSYFLAGIPLKELDDDYLSKIQNEPEGSSVDVADTTTIESHAYYAGHAAVAGPDNDTLHVFVVVESHDPFAQTDMSFDIIRYEERPGSLAPEDQLLYCEFSHGKMIRASDPEVPKSIPLPEDAQAAIGSGAPSAWSQLQFPSGRRTAYFIRSGNGTGNTVYAIALGTPLPLYSTYRILRLGTVFALCMGVVFLFAGFIIRKRMLPVSLTFPVRLQLALLFVAAIPTVIVWITVQQIIADNATAEHELALKRSISAITANLPSKGKDTLTLRQTLENVSDRECYRIRITTGTDLNIYTGKRLTATSRPGLYETSLISSSLPPQAYLGIILEERDFVFASEVIGDYSYFVGYSALREPNGKLAGVLSTPALFAPEITQQAYIYATASQYVWFALIIVLVVFASSLLARQIARPLRTLIEATQAIAAGDLTRKVETRGSREIEELGSSFNLMTRQLEASQQNLAAAERELAWKEMAKQVAHEIRNPLTPMRLAAQHLRHAYKEGADNIGELVMKVTDTILEQVEKLNRISTEFSRFARMPRRTLERVNLVPVIEESLRLFRHTGGVELHLQADEGAYEVSGDREELSSVFTNLLRNAVQAIDETGEIRVWVRREMTAIAVDIADTGSGIPEEVLPRIFEPSFSTKTDGMGLGLAIIKKILDDMGADIAIESVQGEGTTVRILFPEE